MLKTMRVIPWDRKKKSFIKWTVRFTGKLSDVELGVINGTIPVPKHDAHLDATTDKEEIKARQANKDVRSKLLHAISDDVNFNIIANAKSADLPFGDAKVAWDSLKEKNTPTTAGEKQSLKDEFTACELKNWKIDPDSWFTMLDTIKAQLETNFQYTIQVEDFRDHLINKLAPEYQTVKTLERMKLNDGADLPIENIKRDIRERFKELCRENNMDPDDALEYSSGEQ